MTELTGKLQKMLYIIWEKYKKIELTGSQATPFTRPECPLSTQTISGNFSAFQTITELSTLQLASHLSKGDHAKSNTSPVRNN